MPAGTLLGRFLITCRERIKNKSLGGPILNRGDTTELQNLLDFGNLFPICEPMLMAIFFCHWTNARVLYSNWEIMLGA
jgi:hypothetical protein